jgi:hypothetical protein
LCGVALGKGEDSFEAIPEILACRATWDQSWDAEAPQITQATCLVEVFEEREGSVAGQEVHEIARDAVQFIEDAGARGRSCRSSGSGRCLRCVVLWGGSAEEEERAAAPRDATVPGARAPLDIGRGSRWKACEGPAQSSAHIAAAYADRPQSQCWLPRLWRKAEFFGGRWRLVQAFWSPTCGTGRL